MGSALTSVSRLLTGTGKCVTPRDRGFDLIYGEVCQSRVRGASVVPAGVSASGSGRRSLLLGSVLTSGSRRLPGTGKRAIVDRSGSLSFIGSVSGSGDRRRPNIGKCVIREIGDSRSSIWKRLNLGRETSP